MDIVDFAKVRDVMVYENVKILVIVKEISKEDFNQINWSTLTRVITKQNLILVSYQSSQPMELYVEGDENVLYSVVGIVVYVLDVFQMVAIFMVNFSALKEQLLVLSYMADNPVVGYGMETFIATVLVREEVDYELLTLYKDFNIVFILEDNEIDVNIVPVSLN